MKNTTNKTKKEDFLFAVVEDRRISDRPVICVTPHSLWKKKKELAIEYDDAQYAILYKLINAAGLNELMEGIYEIHDPYMTIDEIEYELEQAGFLRNDDFIDYASDADLF